MSKSIRGLRVAGVASLAVTLSIGVAAPAFAVPDFTFDRIGGEDRYQTAADIADEYGVKPDAIVANGQPGFYADALASNYLSGAEDAPILLTRMKELPQHTLDQLDQMNADNVWIVGGESVVPAEQEAQLESAGYNVTRIAGDDRFETNAKVLAADGNSTGGLGLIATGFNFPDALAAGPFAYNGHSLGLSTKDDVKDVVLDALKADGVTEVLIFGGLDAVGAGVEADLASRGITVRERFAGADRSETSELAAEWALANLNFTNTHVGVASGYTLGYGADALAGGPLEGMQDAPMLITRNVDNPDDVNDYLKAHCSTLETGHIFGGPVAVSVAAEASMEAAASCAAAGNQDFDVTPQEAAVNPASTDAAPNQGRREYTVSGLTAGTTYRLELFPAENVSVDESNNVTFVDANGDNLADDDGNTTARIETVNGSSTNQADEQNVTASAQGTVTFTIDASGTESVVPVIWLDADTTAGIATPDQELDLVAPTPGNNNPKQPAEDFAIGGEKSWFVEANAGVVGADQNITNVDKDANFFDAGGERYFYEPGNDVFQIQTPAGGACENVSAAEFEAVLSSGDVLDLTSVYGDDDPTTAGADNSTFCIDNINPDAVAAVDANRTSDTTVTVAINDNDTAQDSFNVYRATDATPLDACPDFNTAGTANRGAYALVGNVAEDGNLDAPEESFSDTGLAPNTKYCYAVTSVNDGDESDTGTQDNTTTLPAGGTALPESVDAYVADDTDADPGPFVELGTVNAGDVWRVAFDEPLADPNGVFRVADSDGSRTDVDCNTSSATAGQTEAACTLNTTQVTIDGTTYEIGEVLTVTLNSVGTVTGDGTLSYPLTVTQASGFGDADGDGEWTPAGDPDNVIDDEGDKTESGTF